MNKYLFVALLSLFFFRESFSYAQKSTDHFDFNKRLRVDFVLAGNSQNQSGFIVRLSQFSYSQEVYEPLISPFDYGEYRLFLLHAESGDTLYYKGFSTLFEEWRFIEEATIKTRAFEQTVVVPFPTVVVQLVVEARTREGNFTPLFGEVVEPSNLAILHREKSSFETKIIFGAAEPSHKVDLLFVAEGYTESEQMKFFCDVERLTKRLLAVEPYASRRNDFTIRAVAAISEESGTDDPQKNRWRNTILNSTFNTFGVDRYLESESLWKIHDVITGIPCDHAIVLVNSNKYGGGGIYNHFSIITADNNWSAATLIHELGHGLIGLGDEYFDNNVTFVDYINLNTEPWQPNLTTLVDFEQKWKDLIAADTPIPTPIRLQYEKTTGVFEGGGYTSKGVYRPAIDCRMRSSNADEFCEVCQRATHAIIDAYVQFKK